MKVTSVMVHHHQHQSLLLSTPHLQSLIWTSLNAETLESFQLPDPDLVALAHVGHGLLGVLSGQHYDPCPILPLVHQAQV
jgi:hypothetical protein